MKVLDVTEFYSERGGGVRSHLSLKGHLLCQLGHEHVVVAPGGQNDEILVEEAGERPDTPAPTGNATRGPRRGRARLLRVRGPASPYDPTYHLFTRFDRIAEIVRAERPDVLEIHSPYLAAVGALRASAGTYGVRTFQWHSDFVDTYAGVLKHAVATQPLALRRTTDLAADALGRSLWALVRGLSGKCAATLVASRWQASKLEAHGVRNVRRLPFGIERGVFRPEMRTSEGRRTLLALAGRSPDDDVPIFVGLGRFAIEKRWSVVLDAFATVRAKRDAVLVLFGDGPERARLAARAIEGVSLPGFVRNRAELAGHLASADALVHGCPFETFGLSIAEAMSTGLPTVLPDAGGAAELHDPACGESYISGDSTDAARAMLRMLDRVATRRESMRDAARAVAGALPDILGQFEAQVKLYEELLGSRSAQGAGSGATTAAR